MGHSLRSTYDSLNILIEDRGSLSLGVRSGPPKGPPSTMGNFPRW